jgi:hypothetical protein
MTKHLVASALRVVHASVSCGQCRFESGRLAGAGGRAKTTSAASTPSAARFSTNGKPNMAGWKASDTKRLKVLENENAKLKELLSDAMLDNAMLKDVASKNGGRELRNGRYRFLPS